MADSTAPSSTRLVDRIDRRTAAIGGVALMVLILLALAIPGGRRHGLASSALRRCPSDARAATVVDLDAEVPAIPDDALPR